MLVKFLDGTTREVANLMGADLHGADLHGADLHGADLHGADLTGANLRGADLHGADLSRANLSGADLRGADLHGADLHGADLRYADLSGADLSGADLSGADLHGADLSCAGLNGAGLNGANLSCANLSCANLSCAKGLLNAAQWLKDNFETDDKGVIVYKTFCAVYAPNQAWKIGPGEVITEVSNKVATDTCGCGINFATKKWVQDNYPNFTIWKCRIEWLDLADVTVPYNTDGKARCERMTLLEVVS